jgi:hypothetical protein
LLEGEMNAVGDVYLRMPVNVAKGLVEGLSRMIPIAIDQQPDKPPKPVKSN